MGKDKHATLLGKKGGRTRANKLSPEQRSKQMRKLSALRWSKTSKAKRKVIMETVRAAKISVS